MSERRSETQIALTPELSKYIATLNLTPEDRLILETEAVYPAIRHDLDRIMTLRKEGATSEADILFEEVINHIQIIKQGNQEI